MRKLDSEHQNICQGVTGLETTLICSMVFLGFSFFGSRNEK